MYVKERQVSKKNSHFFLVWIGPNEFIENPI